MSVAVHQQAMAPDVEMLATIAHDLRNPLTIVQMSAHLLRREAESQEALPRWLDQGLSEIEEAGMRMACLLEELGDLIRIRAGAPLHLCRRLIDLAAIARRAAAAAHATSKHHQIQLKLAQPSVVGYWDEARLRRVLENLLSNAIKYSAQDGVIVVRVYREVSANGACAVLAVRDHGRGIPAADQPHIFEPFWRGSNVDRVAGSGLGLASVRQIVEAHGGSITVKSGKEAGTIFTVRLPQE